MCHALVGVQDALLPPDVRPRAADRAQRIQAAAANATANGDWPVCAAHGSPLFVHPYGWGWRCQIEEAHGQATTQPYGLVAGKGVRVDPKGLTPPDDPRARPSVKAQREARWAASNVGGWKRPYEVKTGKSRRKARA